MAKPYSLDVLPAVRYCDALRDAPDVARVELGLAVDEAAMLLTREVKEATPTGVGGLLRASITQERRDTDEATAAAVFSPLNYAAAVELGTKPHRAPIEPLQDWVRARISLDPGQTVEGVAWAIWGKIAAHGTKPAAMFATAIGRVRQQVTEIGARAVARIYSRLSGGV